MDESNSNQRMEKNETHSTHNTNYNFEEENRRMQEYVKKRQTQRRRELQRRRIRRNRISAVVVLALLIFIIVKIASCNSDSGSNADSSSISSAQSSSKAELSSSVSDKKADTSVSETKHDVEVENGMTFVDGILIVNKTYSLPSDYAPGVSSLAQEAFNKMAEGAAQDGITLFINSSYRSYDEQVALYNSYASERGTAETDKVSSRPGHSEHQTGLAFDVNTTELSFEGTPEALWLDEHCDEYGFIIRFPKGKEDKTGYAYEPWHIRYVGIDEAKKITDSGLCLEEYLGVTSDYKDATDSYCDSVTQ